MIEWEVKIRIHYIHVMSWKPSLGFAPKPHSMWSHNFFVTSLRTRSTRIAHSLCDPHSERLTESSCHLKIWFNFAVVLFEKRENAILLKWQTCQSRNAFRMIGNDKKGYRKWLTKKNFLCYTFWVIHKTRVRSEVCNLSLTSDLTICEKWSNACWTWAELFLSCAVPELPDDCLLSPPTIYFRHAYE